MKRLSNGPSAATAKPTLKLAAEIPSRKPTLIPTKIEQECVDYLREMLQQAETGELIGFAVATLYKQGNYTVNSMGEVYRSPTFALGMVALLKNHILKRILSKSGA